MSATEKKCDIDLTGVVDLLPSDTLNVDEAVDAIFTAKKWPLLGGPSGRGWSFWSASLKCGQYFYRSYDAPDARVRKLHAEPLQIGALFHVLSALYYGGGLGNAYVVPERGGLLAEEFARRGRQRRWKVPPTAADELLVALKAMCEEPDLPAPSLGIVLEAERIFNAHTNWWDHREDVTPLGVELFAAHPHLDYTVRYDMIARVGKDDPTLPPGVYIFEKKSAKWIDELYLEGWRLDGEVLGQLMCWPGSMEKLFGKLEGLVVDVISKGRVPEARRIVIPPGTPAIAKHEKWIQLQGAQVQQWRALKVYPQNFANCYGRWGRCSEWQNCVAGLDGVIR